MVSRGARRIEIRGAGDGETSVRAVGATLAVARVSDTGAGRRATAGRPYGEMSVRAVGDGVLDVPKA